VRNLACPKANPEQLLQAEFYEDTESKILFQAESEEELRSPFEFAQFEQSPIADKTSGHSESIIASFNSADMLDERRPRKI
jgi:hypothetical protein